MAIRIYVKHDRNSYMNPDLLIALRESDLKEGRGVWGHADCIGV